jgi:hypothetical protein
MKLSYTVALNDYRAAQRLHRIQTLGRRIFWLLLLRIVPVFGFLVLVSELYSWFARPSGFSQNSPALLVVPVVLILLPAINLNLTRKQFNQLFPPTGRSLSLDLDDERIICENPGSSESKFLWSAINAFAQNDRVTMLYLDKARFLFFPTSAMTPAQRAELSDLVARHVVNR